MAGVNKVILVGSLGADPESRSMNTGGQVVNLRLATSETWKDRDGNRQEKTEWHRVTIWNEHHAKTAMSYLKKGSKVYLEGAIQTRKWTDQSGAEKFATEIVLAKFKGELTLLDSRSDSPRQETPKPASRGGPATSNFDDDLDGDSVPFLTMTGREPGTSKRRL